MNRSGSPQMPRSIDGHGSVTVRYPPCGGSTLVPSSARMSIRMPGSGTWALPGLRSVMPGSAEIMIAPVSVCHQVSTTGVAPSPITSRYQIQASGLIGSPTEPIRRRLDRSKPSGTSRPSFMKVRIAVGAV